MFEQLMNGLHYHKHKLYRRLKRIRGRIWHGLAGPEPESLERIKPTFLLSTGRTGTTFLAKFFGRAMDLLAKHEPQPDLSDLGVNYVRGRTSRARARQGLKANRSWIVNKMSDAGAERYFEANHFLFSMPKILKSIFPRAQFIHVVRDGRDFLRSGHSKGYYQNDDMYDRPRANEFPQNPFYDEWADFDRFQKIAWYWQFKDRSIENALDSLDPTLKIRFEDMFSAEDDYPGIKKMMDFVGVEISSWRELMKNKERSTSEYSLPRWKDWDKEQRQKFEEIAGKHLEDNSYSW